MNIQAVARRTGVPAPTLRKWEQRYGVLKPERTTGAHRRYDDHDVLRVEWLKARLTEGFRIGEAARLLGAAARIRERTGTLVPTRDRVAYERDVAATRATLGEEAFAAAWTAGEALPLKEAVAEADAFLAATVIDLTATGVPLDPDPVARSGLSPRELEVVRLIATGCSNQDIADALFIGHGTATTHVRNILTKLNLDNRAAVAAWATRHHLA